MLSPQHFLLVVLLFTFTQRSFSQELDKPTEQLKSVKPGINDSFLNPELNPEEFVARFEVESREIFSARKAILEAVNLKEGQSVGDIGTGTGLFLKPFSRAVGEEGWVFAVDIAPKFIERIGKISRSEKLRNVTPVLCGETDVRLPPNCVDVAFVCDVYHHFEYPQASLASLYRAIKPGGQLILIDFERIEGKTREWLLNHVRAGKSVFRKEVEFAGFEFDEEVNIEGLSENYFLRFRKPQK